MKSWSKPFTDWMEAIVDYDQMGLDSIRDGVIQRFEFCVELAWKTLREYLLDQGYTEINSPKSVMKQAFADRYSGSLKKAGSISWMPAMKPRISTMKQQPQLYSEISGLCTIRS